MFGSFYRKSVVATAVGLVVSLQYIPTASAQIEEVIVTAQKREENLQFTPLAVSAMPSDKLEKMGITDFSGIAKSMPSLTVSPYPSSDTLILFMRGQGTADPMQITADSPVGLYIDGHFISRPQAALFDLADLERVEVLRGPQGTLYGRNTTGGAVNLISKAPTGEFGFKQSFTFGTRNQFRSLTSVDLPEIGGLSSKVTLLKSSRDGHVRNAGNSNDFGKNEQLAGRLMLKWQASENLTVDYALDMGELESTPVYYQNTNDTPGLDLRDIYPGYKSGSTGRTYRSVDLPMTKVDFEGHGLTVTWDVNDTFTIKSLTGYRELSFDGYQDYAEAFIASMTTLDIIQSYQFSQELQFIGSALDERLQYISGLYYFSESGSHGQFVNLDSGALGGGYTSKERYIHSESEAEALYAQLTWTPGWFDDRLDLIVGARYTRDKRSATRDFIIDDSLSGVDTEFDASNSQRSSRFNPAFTVNVNWSDELSTYAKVVTGYKAGGSAEGPPIGEFSRGYGPEDVTSYELGIKSYWLDRRLRLNAAAFYSDFEDMQMTFTIDPNDNSITAGYNAGEAVVSGFELELLFQPVDDLQISLDYSYLDTQMKSVDVIAGTAYDQSTNPGSPYTVGDDIKDLFTVSYAPRHSVNAGIDYTFFRFSQGELSFNTSYRWQAESYHSAVAGPAVAGRDQYLAPSFGLLDARVTMALDLPKGDSVRIGLWGKNIANKNYRELVSGIGDQLIGYSSAGVSWAEPPSYGIDLVYEY